MIPDQTFYCPHCGAPGHIKNGATEYSCTCRFGHQFSPAPVVPAPYPAPQWPSYPGWPYGPFVWSNTSSGAAVEPDEVRK